MEIMKIHENAKVLNSAGKNACYKSSSLHMK